MIDFNTLADKYGTPLYVYDFDHITQQYEKLKKAFAGRKSLISYAVKANSNLSLISHLASLGSGADCVSIGEVRRALMAGIPKYQIIFSGVGKRDDEIEEALKSDILLLNLESEAEMERVEEISKKLGKQARISIRVNPNIDPKTHPYISTGLHENKFGVDLETAKRMYIRANNSDYLDPIGIHFHIGSQLTELEPIKESAQIVADLVRSLKAIKIDIKFFDVGGGLGIVYDNETTIEPYDYAQAIFSTLYGLDVTIICEPGRFMVGNCGYFLTKVLYEKVNEGKRFIIVDGAMNDLLRPSLYNAYHKVEVVGKDSSDGSEADVVGPVCESGDFLAKKRVLPKTEHNDLIVVHSAGAYGFVMSGNYNTRPRPAEVALKDGKDTLIRVRETFEDLIKLEKMCL
ncbi:diaminopimelate decarboxylase [Hydrogenimonas thermophila]|uniref:Diaminopimelate decarboxylase n=1 Tax=Hydrogenimonas thermophila TaxID=223786 RepID=A0A1I5Q2M7_9BACT|nr:diaminopimelate decarboxylase [Hydrogenimonas thermophila]WOE70383.1 diaminopimelate decarboxylase [Hydrogenimonas thermophila]WOE72898.1 diaminopimelate decarboxylase [Hydrogenimonas thermophila]SFP40493.1 diaminopimelate decarboxylase [Hydrogenimonas thermophila]